MKNQINIGWNLTIKLLEKWKQTRKEKREINLPIIPNFSRHHN